LINRIVFFLSLIITIFLFSGSLYGSDNYCPDTNSFALCLNGKVFIKKIEISGNKITKREIILRELVFSQDDSILQIQIEDLLQQSRENLINTSLFNYVDINYELNNNNLTLSISVEERWYTWPIPVLEQADRNLPAWLKRKDLSMLNYGLYFMQENFRGKRETLKLKTVFGYREQYSVLYLKPYIDKHNKHGLALEMNYYRQKELIVSTVNNKPDYVTDNKNYLFNHISTSLNYSFRPYLYSRHIITVNYNNASVSDTISKINPNYFTLNNTSIRYYSLMYSFINDKRDYRTYPLRGSYINMGIEKTGLGISNNSPDLLWFTLKYRAYEPLFKRLFFGMESSLKKSFGDIQPYFIQKAFGYKNFLRGFEYYLIDGQDYFLLKNTLRYELLPKTVRKLSFVPLKKFRKIHYSVFISANFDLGYVRDSQNQLNNDMTNQYLYSGGIGLDFVTYYDRIIKIQYSVNNFGESGFFLHFVTPVVGVFY